MKIRVWSATGLLLLLSACTDSASEGDRKSLSTSESPAPIRGSMTAPSMSPSTSSTSSALTAIAQTGAIVTGTWKVQDTGTMQSAMLAPFRGMLLVDDRGCLRVRVNGMIVTVIWPSGYRASGSGDATAVVDESGRAVARVGDEIYSAGGYGRPPDSATGDCMAGVTDVFVANATVRTG